MGYAKSIKLIKAGIDAPFRAENIAPCSRCRERIRNRSVADRPEKGSLEMHLENPKSESLLISKIGLMQAPSPVYNAKAQNGSSGMYKEVFQVKDVMAALQAIDLQLCPHLWLGDPSIISKFCRSCINIQKLPPGVKGPRCISATDRNGFDRAKLTGRCKGSCFASGCKTKFMFQTRESLTPDASGRRQIWLIIVIYRWLGPLLTDQRVQSWNDHAPLDPSVQESLKDYDMTSPLLADGSNFACKNYQYTDTNSQADTIKAVYQAGDTYNMTITGTATHLGGSCQISLSYDNGASFKVIQSQIGGCSLAKTHNFTIPSFATSSDSVLLSWSWFNLVGNREMYQNCARVQIQNQNHPIPRYRRAMAKRESALDDLPDMFVCNVGNGCTTIERSEVVFPDPGDDVVTGQDEVTPNPGPGYTLTSSTVSETSTTSGFNRVREYRRFRKLYHAVVYKHEFAPDKLIEQ
ncbi:hypothetical protein DV735_g104, partial [Chaetothyriales sp. CBS 134920]